MIPIYWNEVGCRNSTFYIINYITDEDVLRQEANGVSSLDIVPEPRYASHNVCLHHRRKIPQQQLHVTQIAFEAGCCHSEVKSNVTGDICVRKLP